MINKMNMNNFSDFLKPVDYEFVVEYFVKNKMDFNYNQMLLDFGLTLYDYTSTTFFEDELFEEADIKNHFNWCYAKTVEDFAKQGITISDDGGQVRMNFEDAIFSTFYENKSPDRLNYRKYLVTLSNLRNGVTKTDLFLLKHTYEVCRGKFSSE